MQVTEELASKVLSVVDLGLCSGMGKEGNDGKGIPGQMCVEAAVCYAMDLPHSDKPTCVNPVLRSLKITLNDKGWSSNEARAKGLRRIAIAQLGTMGTLDEDLFIKKLNNLTIRKVVPKALRFAASMKQNEKHKDSLESAAADCEETGNRESCIKAKNAAYAAASAASAAAYAAYAADAAADAAAYDAARAAYYAAHAAAAASAAAYAASAAAYAADAAAAAASAASAAADAAAKDQELAYFAEEVVQILIEMKTPGSLYVDKLAPLTNNN